MKLNINVFLLKEGKDKRDIFSDPGELNHVVTNISDSEVDFYWSVKRSTPKWLGVFSENPDIGSLDITVSTAQALLVMEYRSRIFCFAFGHARHLIDQAVIERYFGLKVALSLTDPELIKSIDKSLVKRTPLRSRTQSSKYVSLPDFDFESEWQILKSLTGVVESDSEDDYEVVSGTDSVSLYTDIDIDDIESVLARLYDAYIDDRYKDKFPVIDHVVPVRDKVLKDDLDAHLVSKINGKEYSDVWIAPPELMDYQNFSGFCYNQRHRRNASPVTDPDLDLERCLRAKRAEAQVTIPWLSNTKITVFDGNYNQIACWPLYICLNGEVSFQNNLYLISEGEWYQVEWDFYKSVDRYFSNFPRSSIDLPPYRGCTEPDYLNKISNRDGFYLMDRKLVKAKDAPSGFEFCDLLTSSNELIHVKKYSSSNVLSHLFAQGYVSAESLLREPDIADQVNDKLDNQDGFEFVFKKDSYPRDAKVVFAIMQEKKGFLHMPFFSKVHFKNVSQRLLDMGFSVELKKIRFDDSGI